MELRIIPNLFCQLLQSYKLQFHGHATVPFHPNNLTNKYDVIGHVPKLMARWLTKFLKRPSDSAGVIIKGKRVNRGGGYGLEVPCEYHLKGTISRAIG